MQKIELKEYISGTDTRGFNIMYEGSGNNNFKIQRNSNGSTDVDALTINRGTGDVEIKTDTESTSTATGALTVDGGVSIAKNLRFGGRIYGSSISNNSAAHATSSNNKTVKYNSITGEFYVE